MQNILLVDADPTLLRTLANLLRIRGGFFNIMTAGDGREAVKIIRRVKTDLVITGLRMPEMGGLQLLAYLNRKYPDIKVVVMADAESTIAKAKMKKLGPATYLEEPVDISELTHRVFTELSTDYGGRVRGISLSSFLQMIELDGKTCILTIHADGKTGRLFIEKGDLVAAEFGALNGKTAALEILSWDHIHIDIDYSPVERSNEIGKPLMNLLLESVRIKDEKGSKAENRRRSQRVECLIAVDYDISDWSYKSFVRNISMGGVYIETDQPISVGQGIMITFSTKSPSRQCGITGIVVRRDNRGIGIRFDQLSLYQQQVINSLMGAEKESDGCSNGQCLD